MATSEETPKKTKTVDELEDEADELNAKYVALSKEYRQTSDVEVLKKALEYITQAVEVTNSELFACNGTRAAHLTNLGRCHGLLFQATGVANHLDDAVEWTRKAVQTVPETSRLRPLCYVNLSDALSSRYFGSGSKGRTDIDEALEQARTAVAAAPEGNVYFGTARSTLASRLAQFQKNIEPSEEFMNEAVSISEELVRATPEDDEMHGVYVFNLGGDIQDRFHRYGKIEDLHSAKQYFSRAMKFFPAHDSVHIMAVQSYAGTVWDVADATGESTELEQAIEALNTLETTVHSEQELSKIGQQKSRLYEMKYKLFSDVQDLDRSVEIAEKALKQQPPNGGLRPAFLSQLSTSLGARAEVRMSQDDIDAAIEYATQGVHATADAPARQGAAYGSLALRLSTKFELFGGLENLEDSLKNHRHSVALLPLDHRDRPTKLHNLAINLRKQFEHNGAVSYLDESIASEREAAESLPKSHPDRGMALDGLSHSLSMRFKHTGNSQDLDESIVASESAVNAVPSGHKERPAYLNGLSNRLSSRYSITKEKEDLDRSIAGVTEALAASSSDVSSECIYLVTLANCLRKRYEAFGDVADIDLCIEKERLYLSKLPSTNPDKVNGLHNMGLSYQAKYHRVTDQEEKRKCLEEALDLATQCVDLTPKEHPSLPGFLTQQATRQLWTALFMDESDEEKLLAQMRLAGLTYERAFYLTYDTPLGRVVNGKLGGYIRLQSKDYEGASKILSETVELFRRVSPLSLKDNDRQRQLSGLSGISSLACAAYLSMDEPAKGLEALEAGRGIMANLAMGNHADLSDLKEADTDLHNEYVRLRNILSLPLPESSGSSFSHGTDLVATRNKDHAALEDVENRIRSLSGFENFNKSLTAAQLQKLAVNGPVVAFCTVDQRCDALIVTESTIKSIPLPGLSNADIKKRIQLVVGTSRLSKVPPTKRGMANKKLLGLLEWLWTNAVEPVLQHLDLLVKQELLPAQKPRLWWVASGPLGLLPLHAAGKGRKSPIQNTYANVISSYVPSFSSLAFARQCQAKIDSTAPSLALITMPNTPGGLAALTTEDESKAICETFDISHRQYRQLCQPSAADVMRAVYESEVDILHLACHAEPDHEDPSKTALLFGADIKAPEPDPLPVGQLRKQNSGPHSDRRPLRLAYLSACCTAQQYDLRLIDENIHLASVFLLCGFPAVIGTLWEADDTAAVIIAKEFYHEMFRLDSERAGTGQPGEYVARALDHATTMYRSRKIGRGSAADDALAWANFVHLGA